MVQSVPSLQNLLVVGKDTVVLFLPFSKKLFIGSNRKYILPKTWSLGSPTPFFSQDEPALLDLQFPRRDCSAGLLRVFGKSIAFSFPKSDSVVMKKYFNLAIRLLLGALFLFASISYFGKFIEEPEMSPSMKIFQTGLDAAGYLMPLVKVIELLCGIAFVSGFFVPLAALLLAPISINIFCIHLWLEPSGLPVGIFVLGANAYLASLHWDLYQKLFQPKPNRTNWS